MRKRFRVILHLFVNHFYIQKNKRYKLEKQKNGKHGNTLIISNAEQKDGGDYVCKVSANDRIEVKHKIQIRGKKNIKDKYLWFWKLY